MATQLQTHRTAAPPPHRMTSRVDTRERYPGQGLELIEVGPPPLQCHESRSHNSHIGYPFGGPVGQNFPVSRSTPAGGSKRLSWPVDGPACFSAGLLLSGGGSELVHALMGEADDGCYVTVW